MLVNQKKQQSLHKIAGIVKKMVFLTSFSKQCLYFPKIILCVVVFKEKKRDFCKIEKLLFEYDTTI